MPPSVDNIVWIFLHLRKSGGTTLGAHAARHMKFDEDFISLSHWGRTYREEQGRPGLESRSPAERRKIRLIAGHDAFHGVHNWVPDKDPRYITFTREPAARFVSLYNYRRSTGRIAENFSSWLDTRAKPVNRNPMTKFYAGCLFGTHTIDDSPADNLRAAKAMLDRCWLVTTTEHLNDDLSPLLSAMGLPTDWTAQRVAGSHHAGSVGSVHEPANRETIHRHIRLDESIRARIADEHPADIELHAYAGQRRRDTLMHLDERTRP